MNDHTDLPHPDRSVAGPTVVVIGGGPAGLTAAITAADTGARVVLLERRAGLGGRARTDRHDGCALNLGAHALYADGAARRWLVELGVDPAGHRPEPASSIVVDHRGVQRFPDGPVALLRSGAVPWRAKPAFGRLLAGVGRLARRAPADRSAAAVIAERTPPSVHSLLHAVVRLTTYAPDADLISADAAFTQLELGLDGGVRYLDGGWQGWIDDLAGIATARGVDIRRGSAARAVTTGDGGLVVELDDDAITADRVIGAIPPAAMRRLLGTDPWPGLAPAAVASVLDLGVDLGAVRHEFGLGLDDGWYMSLHGPPAAGLAPAGQGLLSGLRYARADETLDPDRERATLLAAAGHLGVGPADIRSERFLHRMVTAESVPSPDTGGLAGRPDIAVAGHPGVFVCGDWVGPDGLLVDASVASARRAGAAAGATSAPRVVTAAVGD